MMLVAACFGTLVTELDNSSRYRVDTAFCLRGTSVSKLSKGVEKDIEKVA